MRILFLDIESSPILTYVWGTWKQNINPDMIVEPSKIICFAAKWLGETETKFYSVYHDSADNMLLELWLLLNAADVVVHYNGKKFDIPRINTAFITYGFTPPSPYRQIDLLLTVRSIFEFDINKLGYVSKVLKTSGKKETGGIGLWLGCMKNDPDSWKKMMEYNIQDILTLEECYNMMLPWITGHPSFAAFSGKLVCPSCGKDKLTRRGYYYTSVSKYARFMCENCGTWSRNSKRVSGAEITGVAL